VVGKEVISSQKPSAQLIQGFSCTSEPVRGTHQNNEKSVLRVRSFYSQFDSTQGQIMVKVIASSLRKGNVVEMDGRLHTVIVAENIHPGKGTPVTQLDMRRMGDGVKVSVRFRTTESVEKAELDTRDYQYLYREDETFHFMNQENFDQVQVNGEVIGDAAPYLQENMIVQLSMFGDNAVAIEIPKKVILEIVETEPVTKGQTASSSYKPAILSNGVRTTVPPHVSAGTRIWVNTEDAAYLERAKDGA
jgi:elongation factor P